MQGLLPERRKIVGRIFLREQLSHNYQKKIVSAHHHSASCATTNFGWQIPRRVGGKWHKERRKQLTKKEQTKVAAVFICTQTHIEPAREKYYATSTYLLYRLNDYFEESQLRSQQRFPFAACCNWLAVPAFARVSRQTWRVGVFGRFAC